MSYDQSLILDLLRGPFPDKDRLEADHRSHLASQRNAADYLINGLQIHCPADIYHPQIGSSSLFLLSHLKQCRFGSAPLVLEIGVGCGAVLLGLASFLGRGTYCGTDISSRAVQAFLQNAGRNGIVAEGVESDLFRQLPPQRFDAIIFNPPLYDKITADPVEKMLMCDPGGELLSRFLHDLPSWISPGGAAYLLVSNITYPGVFDALPADHEFLSAELLPSGFVRALLKLSY
ncbi:MAG: methyltransferase [Gammaproteobacteria bacterium]|nr:methyltransferase [Gammaproteobacteria bacterium]